jgi:enoyl-CoA hydratase
MNYECITTRVEGERVGLICLNRPKQLNALNDQLMDELGHALKGFDANGDIGCMVITGNEKAFAAGADITAMAKLSFSDAYKGDFITRNWETIRTIRKPVIAAVNGFALGGGCELAMMCDFIIASDTAKFGHSDKLLDEALAAALMICSYSQVATMAAKESVNRSFEGTLADGITFERRLFHALFATDDQKEGMDAFVGKRKPEFKHQ